MSEKVFFDTNILFYAFDSSEPDKQSVAQEFIASAMASAIGWISVQVLGEFFHTTVIRKKLMSSEDAEQAILSLSALNIVDVDRAQVRTAIAFHRQYQTSYWDSLILASAKRARCSKLITEDFSHDQDYDGLKVFNPFL
jgi:predicted nucleic acid-binding protein